MDVPLSLLDRKVNKAIFITLQSDAEQVSLLSLIHQLKAPNQTFNFNYCASMIYKNLKGLSSWLTEAAFVTLLNRLGFCSLYLNYGHNVLLELFKYPIVLVSSYSGKRLLLSEPHIIFAPPSRPLNNFIAPAPRNLIIPYTSNCLEEFIAIIQEHPMNVRFRFFCKMRPYIRAFHSLEPLGSQTAIWHLSILPSQCLSAFYQSTPSVTFKFPYTTFYTRSFSSLLQSCTSHGRLTSSNGLNRSIETRVAKLVSIFRSKMKRLSHNLAFLKDKKLQSLLQSFEFDGYTRVFLDETGASRSAPLPIPVHKITLYLMLYCKYIGAFAILGKHNVRIFHRRLFCFVSQPINGFTTLRELTSGISIKEFLLPATTLTKIESEVRQHLLAYFVVYLMDFVILPALYQSFSATAMHTELFNRIEKANFMVPALLYRSLWHKYKTYLITSNSRIEIAATYEFVSSLASLGSNFVKTEDSVEAVFWKHVSPGRLSFIYKSNGKVRPLCNFSFCDQKYRLSLNSFLRCALHIITFELKRPRNKYLQAHLARNLQYIENDYTAWLNNVYIENNEAQVYMVVADMITAFESVSIPRLLYYVSNYIITECAYIILTYKEIVPGKSPKVRATAMSYQCDEHVSIDSISRHLLCKEASGKPSTSLIYPMYAKVYKREEIIKMLELHLLNSLVIHEGRVYRLTSGIPQGSIVSTVLFNCYSSLLHVQLLNIGLFSQRLFFYRTFVDDWLLLTTSTGVLDTYMEYMNAMRDHGAYFRLKCFIKSGKDSEFISISTVDCTKEPVLKKSLYTSNLNFNQDEANTREPRYCGYMFLKNIAMVDVLKWLPLTHLNGRLSYPTTFGSKAFVIQRLRSIFRKRIWDLRCFIERNTRCFDEQETINTSFNHKIQIDRSILYLYINAVISCVLCYSRSIGYSESLCTLLRNAFCSLKAAVWGCPTTRAMFLHISKSMILQIYGHNPRIRGLLLGIINK